MAEMSRHDAWQAGESYDAYMGRWSRRIAPLFLDRLGAADGLDWLDVGAERVRSQGPSWRSAVPRA